MGTIRILQLSSHHSLNRWVSGSTFFLVRPNPDLKAKVKEEQRKIGGIVEKTIAICPPPLNSVYPEQTTTQINKKTRCRHNDEAATCTTAGPPSL